MVAVGSLVPLALAVALASLVLPFAALLPSYSLTPWTGALALALFFSLVPPIAEELLFRGFMQRRLLQRWPPAVAILVTAAVFAIFHGNLPQMIVAFVLGIWLGVIAWRTGSEWGSKRTFPMHSVRVYPAFRPRSSFGTSGSALPPRISRPPRTSRKVTASYPTITERVAANTGSNKYINAARLAETRG